MRVARYLGGGEIAVVEEAAPECPPGGLLVQTEACGLCSGELMTWYMDSKIPHVLGHEVSGKVVQSLDRRFPVATRVFPHHHAPCMVCSWCESGRHVHCEQWKRTKLVPGGMADLFAVSADNLTDTHITNDLRPVDAALVEPLACVVKSFRAAGIEPGRPAPQCAVIGLGSMGLLHLLLLQESAFGFDLSAERVQWARAQGLQADQPWDDARADVIFVCPGSQVAFDQAMRMVNPGGTICLFAPLPPGGMLQVRQSAYFMDLTIVNSYSCGPLDTAIALRLIRENYVKAENICSHFIGLDELPERYLQMKAGEILKPMVVWG